MGFNRKLEDNKEPAERALNHPYTRLTPDRVIAAVESTGRLSDARILALNSYENRVYQVGIEDQIPVIVKFYRPNRWTMAQIDEEHRFTRYLHEHEFPVVPPLDIDAAAEYPTIGTHDDFLFAIYPRQGGRAPELDNLEHLHQLGRFIGHMHALGEGFPFQHRLSISVEQAQANVDYDDAITGPAIQDLWMLLSGDLPNQQRQLLEIVEGYETFREFDAAELNLVEPLRAMRVLHFNAWLARRWDDPAFPMAFPWFNTPRYWSEYILELKELLSALQLDAIAMPRI